MKKAIVCFIAACVLVMGCTGSFNLTRKVYDFHRSQDNKWVDEALFLVMVIIPVYGVATFVDGVVLNSIEFWTGENPVQMTAVDNQKIISSGNSEVVLTYNQDDSIDLQSSNFPENTMTLERNLLGVVAKDSHGNIVYSSAKDETGGISIYDGNRNLVKYFTAAEVQAGMERIQ